MSRIFTAQGESHGALRLLRFMAAAGLAYWAGWIISYGMRWDKAAYDLFGDFYMLWTAGRMTLEKGAMAMLSVPDYVAYQHHLRDASFGWYPSPPYPPIFLAVIEQVARLPYVAGVGVWLAGTFALAALALPRRGWRLAFLVFLIAPATPINAVAGHNGFLSAAFALAGFTLLPAHPVLAGVAFGLLSYKPQMFLLVPVMLVVARRWSTLAASLVTAALMALAGVAIYGWDVSWTIFNYLGPYSQMIESKIGEVGRLMPTVMPSMLLLGAPHGVALAVQSLVAVAALAALWRASRGGINGATAGVWAVATFLVTPYAQIYDMCVVTLALVMLPRPWFRDRAEMVVIPLLWAMPAYGPWLVDIGVPAMPLILLAFLAVLMRRVCSAHPVEMSLPCHKTS